MDLLFLYFSPNDRTNEHSQFSKISILFPGDGQPFVIINLTENTEYIYRVATRNPAGLSIYSEEHFFRTRDASSSISNHPSIPSYLIGLLSILLLALRTR